jgi:hypothetical protein
MRTEVVHGHAKQQADKIKIVELLPHGNRALILDFGFSSLIIPIPSPAFRC